MRRLFQEPTTVVAHDAVFGLRQLSKLTGGLISAHIWDTHSMTRLLHPAVILEVAHDERTEALGLASQIMTSITPGALNNRTHPAIHWWVEPNLG